MNGARGGGVGAGVGVLLVGAAVVPPPPPPVPPPHADRLRMETRGKVIILVFLKIVSVAYKIDKLE